MKNKPDMRVFKPGKNKKFPHHTNKCLVCNRPFHRQEAICNFCGSCQRCETINPDIFGNNCIHCGNFIDQGRYNTSAAIHTVIHAPVLPFLEPQDPIQLK